MTVGALAKSGLFEVLLPGNSDETLVTDVFCCDLLSIAMSRGKEGAAFVTVMGNVNTVAVVRLTEMSCIVLAEGVRPDEIMLEKAKQEGVALFASPDGVFESALRLHGLLRSEQAP